MTPNLEKLFRAATQERIEITPRYSKENVYEVWNEEFNYPSDTSSSAMDSMAKKLTLLANHGQELVKLLERAIPLLELYAGEQEDPACAYAALEMEQLLATLEQEAGQ